MEEAAHSPLGGSTLKRWSACPGSIRLSKGIPNRSSKYADEGTRAHEIAASYLTDKKWPDHVDPATKEAVKVYTDTIAEIVRDSSSPRLWVEQKVSLKQIHPQLYGTADCVIYDHETKLLTVIDYKHGSGTVVEVVEDDKPNFQLSYYALGAAFTLNLLIEEVEIIIVQPRCAHPDGPVRRCKFSADYLLEFSADLSDFVKATEDPKAPLKAGPHCKFCPAAGICEMIHTNAMTLAKEEFSPAFTYDPEKLSHVLSWLPVLDGWIENVREFAYREAQHGRVPPGWKLVPKRATRRWRNEKEAESALISSGKIWEDDLFIDPKIKSPAQLEKIFKDKNLIESLTVAESSGLTLVPESDKRQAVKHDVKSDFDVVTE
jgi:hypothetical protein